MTIKTFTVPDFQKLDRWAIEKIGIPSLALMENAGRAVAQEIFKKLKHRKNPSIVIVCGTGNNGGDGFVAARYLYNGGLKPRIFIVGNIAHLKIDTLANYRAAKNLGVSIKSMSSSVIASKAKQSLKSDIIVDAIFGVGLNRPIHEPYCKIIHAINTQNAYVIAVDTPSGLNGTTGDIYGICVKADLTVTFSGLKRGFFKKLGAYYSGRHVVVDIGIPMSSFQQRKIK